MSVTETRPLRRYSGKQRVLATGGMRSTTGRYRIAMEVDDRVFNFIKRMAVNQNKSVAATARRIIELQIVPRRRRDE